jgi:hypothetical protein
MISNFINQNTRFMKNLKFISGLLLGVLFGVTFIMILKCKSEAPQQISQIPNSMELVKDIDTYSGEVYKLTIDNIQYIVVEKNNSNGVGIAIVKHQ